MRTQAASVPCETRSAPGGDQVRAHKSAREVEADAVDTEEPMPLCCSDWPSHLFTGFLVGGSSQWLPLDRRVMEHSIGQPVIMWASRPRLADKLPVVRQDDHSIQATRTGSS